jgi:hypothetical protein
VARAAKEVKTPTGELNMRLNTPYGEKGYATETADACGPRSTLSSAVQAPPTAISIASRALEEARDLAFRLSNIVDSFCGCQPRAVGPDGKDGISSSAFEVLKQDSARTLNILRDAAEQLSRLERELP